ncbi:MAG TPA: hypothetical protein VET45_21015 [Candidatus Binatia bacterium]|jgi:hypothetical protein|nr:hypothetical protein [Candidatus Binatia bacterium]
MEYLIVRFPEAREVQVDGVPHGRTNIVLQFEAGIHDVTLGPPWNFAPLAQRVLLLNTAALDPYRVEFRILPPAAIPISPGSPP